MDRALRHIALAAILLFSLNSCEKEERTYYTGTGKEPLYASFEALLDIRNEPPQSIQQSGTIYLQDTLFFLLEQRKGIHVFSLRDSLNTVGLTFFKIPAITDFTISGNILYADSWKDLVVIDISNLYAIQVSSRVPDVINPPLYPPEYDGFFECVDESKGAVVGWREASLKEAKCSTF